MIAAQSHTAGQGGPQYDAPDFSKSLFGSDSPTRPTVYVIDDDESMLMALASLLASAGYLVEAFRSGLEFAVLPNRRPACAVVDFLMPDLTGADLQQRLMRGDDPLPLVFLSGHSDVPTAVEVMKAGAVDFLRKPVVADDLLSAVARAVAVDRTKQAERVEKEKLNTRLARLTAREQEVLHGVVQGLLNKQVGARLGITERTVKRHRGMVMHKLGVDSVAELVRFADRIVPTQTVLS
jgi:FixJ family two-component response regulator